MAFAVVGISDWTKYVWQDPSFMRPAEVELLIGDAPKARSVLRWAPKVAFEELVTMMVESDLAELRGGSPHNAGGSFDRWPM